jgi:hypothetical protein
MTRRLPKVILGVLGRVRERDMLTNALKRRAIITGAKFCPADRLNTFFADFFFRSVFPILCDLHANHDLRLIVEQSIQNAVAKKENEDT